MQTPHAKPPGYLLIGIVLLVTFNGCAYYNTFYLAKRYFREGQKAQERSVLDTPSPDAMQRYDAVIRQCAKILVEYPKSKWVDDALYYMGAAMYGKGDYPGAIKKFGELRSTLPKSPYVPDSKLMEALSLYRRKEYTEAEAMFREVETQYPNLKRKWELYFYGAENEVGLRNFPAALAWYKRAAETAGNKRQRAMALRRTGDALFESKDYEGAQAAYAAAFKVEELGSRRLDLALKRGEALEQLKRYDEALAYYESWRPYALNENREGEFLIRKYGLMALQGRTADAINGFQSLVVQYPRTSIAYEAQFRAGYLYESQLSDFDAAGREYEKLKSEPAHSEFKIQATRRAANLATIKQYRTTLQTDTTQARPRAAFLLAELYYFQFEKADSALMQYEAVEREFPQSPYAPKAAFARLWILTSDRSDTLASAALTDSIVSRYRKTRYPESALYLWRRWSGRTDARSALLDSMLAHPDTTIVQERPEELFEPSISVAAQDSARARAAGTLLTPAEEARRDSIANYTRALHRATRQGLPPPDPKEVYRQHVPADTSRTTPAEADTSRTTPAPAPPADADTSRTKEPPTAPADTAGVPMITPSR